MKWWISHHKRSRLFTWEPMSWRLIATKPPAVNLLMSGCWADSRPQPRAGSEVGGDGGRAYFFLPALSAGFAAGSGPLGRLDSLLASLSSSSIQNIQHLLTFVAGAAKRNRQQQRHHFPRTDYVELPSRTHHGRLRHHKAPDFLEGLNERDVFTGIQSLGESTGRSVRLPSAKEETTSHQSYQPGKHHCQ